MKVRIEMHENIHVKRWAAMRIHQKRIQPFVPTIRELADLWGVGLSTAHNTLQVLVYEKELVMARKTGHTLSQYYAVPVI